MAHIEHPNTTPGPQTHPTSHLLSCLVPSSLADYRVRCGVRYTTRRKLGLLNAVERLQHEEGLTLPRVAEHLFVAHLLIVKWKKQQGAGDDPFIALIKTSKNKKAAHAGLLGQLKVIEEPLLRHIFELREQGVMVSTFKMVVRASQLCTTFGAKHFCCTVQRCEALHLRPFSCL
jgi:hypothetical protein